MFQQQSPRPGPPRTPNDPQGYPHHLYPLRPLPHPALPLLQERPGGLVKCRPERIAQDLTAGDLKCPECQQEFARHALIEGRPAHKIIQGKVYTKGMSRK